MKKESLFWTSLLKILHKFYSCLRKGFFEVTILNQVITIQNYEVLLDWKWLRENILLTKYHFILLRLYQESCIFRRLRCYFSNFLQKGKTIHCLQVHDILWNHRSIEEKKILLYSGHLPKLPKSLPARGGPSGRSSASVV